MLQSYFQITRLYIRTYFYSRLIFFRYPLGAQTLTFDKIKPSLRQWRWHQFPRCPKTLLELSQQLEEGHYDRLLNRPGGLKIEWNKIVDAKGDIHLVFYNRRLIIDHLQKIKRMLIDGTFQTRAKLEDCIQLLTVLVIYMAKVMFMHS